MKLDVTKTFSASLKDLICLAADIPVVFSDYKSICIRFLNFMAVSISKYSCPHLRNIYVNDNAKLTGQQRAFTCVCLKFLTLFVIILSLIFEFLGAIRLESEFFTKIAE